MSPPRRWNFRAHFHRGICLTSPARPCAKKLSRPTHAVREVFNFERAAHSEHAGSVCTPSAQRASPSRAHIAALHHTSTASDLRTAVDSHCAGQLEKVARSTRTRPRRPSRITPRSGGTRGSFWSCAGRAASHARPGGPGAAAAAARRRRAGDAGSGAAEAERRCRGGGDAPGAWCGRGRAEKPRIRGRLE